MHQSGFACQNVFKCSKTVFDHILNSFMIYKTLKNYWSNFLCEKRFEKTEMANLPVLIDRGWSTECERSTGCFSKYSCYTCQIKIATASAI